MNYTKIICTIALCGVMMSAVSCRQAAQPTTQKVYKTMTVALDDAQISRSYTASIRGEQFVDIRPQVSGTITSITIDEGAQVKKGQTLFVIDQVPYTAALEVATAKVKSAEVELSTAQLNAESGEALRAEDVISENELMVLRNAKATAEAALTLAKAEETIARNDLSYTSVKSPVDGVASMINYRVGALVSSSIDKPLVSVSNNNKMYAYFSLSESALLSLLEECGSTDALLEQMDGVTLILNNGSSYAHQGKVDAISGVVDQSTGSVGARALFENPDQILRDGGNGKLLISSTYHDAVVIPKVATYEIQNKKFVFKVVDGKATSAEVIILPIDNGKEYIVESGLAVGDVIVAEGAGLLREGTIIN